MTGRSEARTLRLVLAVGDGAPKTLAGICRIVEVAGLTAGSGWTAHRRTAILWDDPDGRLAADGIELSTTGGRGRVVARFVQPDGPLRLRQQEFPAPDAAPPPDVAALDPPAPISIVARRTIAGRHAPLADGSGVIAVETVVDHGSAGDRRGRRLVLEIPSGTAGEALEALRGLPGHLPLRPVSHLPGGREPVRIAVEGIDADSTAGEAFLAIGRAALRQVLGNLDRIADAPVPIPEAIHQLRVGVRRLRAALGLFRRHLDPDRRQRLADGLRSLAQAFGPARDRDVFAVETLAPLRAALGPGIDLGSAVAVVETGRAADRATIADVAWSPAVVATLIDLLAWFEAGAAPLKPAARKPVLRHARKALRQRRRRLVAHHAAGPASVEEWHELRIEAKKLRYATDAFAALYPSEATRPFVRALQEVQDCLGRYNDAAVADALAPALGLDPVATAAVAGWTARERIEQQRRFIGAWKRLRKCRRFW